MSKQWCEERVSELLITWPMELVRMVMSFWNSWEYSSTLCHHALDAGELRLDRPDGDAVVTWLTWHSQLVRTTRGWTISHDHLDTSFYAYGIRICPHPTAIKKPITSIYWVKGLGQVVGFQNHQAYVLNYTHMSIHFDRKHFVVPDDAIHSICPGSFTPPRCDVCYEAIPVRTRYLLWKSGRFSHTYCISGERDVTPLEQDRIDHLLSH